MKKAVHTGCAPGFVLPVLNNISTLISSESLFSKLADIDMLKHAARSHCINSIIPDSISSNKKLLL